MSDTDIKGIFNKAHFNRQDLVSLLSSYGTDDRYLIYEKAKEIKKTYVGDKIYLRALVEYSNLCVKDCLYCGIRLHNTKLQRYTVSDEDVLNCAEYARKHKYASMVIQSGERADAEFTKNITRLLKKIHKLTDKSLKITLSCGEQTADVYREWYEAGAHRYLLRIETSNEELYQSIHPGNDIHDFNLRLKALKDLKDIGYQVGSGIMIGIPGQTIEDLANDLLFLQSVNIDMAGMGPYVEHSDAPMYDINKPLMNPADRFELSLLMYALLRIMMKDINIASTTALDALDPNGRIKALNIACNVLMPNLTPLRYLKNYHLYNNKPDSLNADKLVEYIEKNRSLHGNTIAFGEHGDSKHFSDRTMSL
jgi:biotin synthase